MTACAACVFGLVVAASAESFAAEPDRNADDPPMLSLVVENDSFGGTDRNYSNGLYASLLSAPGDVPDWFARLARQLPNIEDDHTLRRGVGVGHTLFTPRDIAAPNWLEGQHPYAGWLYGSLLGVSEDRNTVRTAQINIGVVGPAAFGEAVQNNFHSLIGVDEAQGWDDQLHNELAFEILLSRQYRALQGRLPIGLDIDLVPELNLALGTVSTQAGAGVMVRIGDRLQNDFGPPRVRAGTAGASYFAVGGEGIDWYAFAGVEGRAVARNIFLDGNTFRDSPSVDRDIWVAEVQAGFVLKHDRYQLGFTAVYRTEEFATQLDPQRFGAISLARRF